MKNAEMDSWRSRCNRWNSNLRQDHIKIETKLFDLMQWVHAHSHDGETGEVDTRILLNWKRVLVVRALLLMEGQATSFAGAPTVDVNDDTTWILFLMVTLTGFIVGTDNRGRHWTLLNLLLLTKG